MSSPAYLIAITGGSGSGKSTLAEALFKRMPAGQCVIFHEDGYYWPKSHVSRVLSAASPDASWEAVIDYDDPASKDTSLMAQHLTRLKAGETIAQPIYDYDAHDRAEQTRTIEPARLIILEGIHALSVAEVASLIDLSIYVDTPDDLRLARRLRRDVVDRGRSVESVLEQYLGTVRAAHYRFTYPTMFQADLVIADEGLPAYGEVRPSKAAIERMMAPITVRLQAEGIL